MCHPDSVQVSCRTLVTMSVTQGSSKMKTSSDLESVLPPMASPKKHNNASLPTANYSALSERIRKSTPSDLQCAFLCGGRRCKYESPASWSSHELSLPGFYSHWVTEDIVAMSRPNAETMKQFNLIKTFKECGIKSIINLQEPGEHSSCGIGLNKSGFSYDPNTFMDNDVFFYNFHWRDYSTVPESVLLDMVKVMVFAINEGKVAIHCHAGLGRTGVLIASYLVYTWRCRPQDAIRFVRSKRPNSIQMRSQIESIFQFAQFAVPLFVVYPHIVPKHYGLNLMQHLKRQQQLSHGYESRNLRHIPKVIYVICERLLQLCNRSKTRSPGLLKMASSESSTSLEQSKEDENSMTVDFQLTGADSFTKYFYSALKYPSGQPSGGIMGLATRPNSNMTIMSGFTSPDTILTELSCGSGSSRRVNTADSGKRVSTNVQSSVDSNAHLHRDNAKALPYIVHSKSSSSAQPSPSSSSATLVDLTPSHTASTSGPSPPLPTPASSSSSSSSSFHHHHHLPSQFAFNSLPPVEELSDTSSSILGDLSDLHGPLRQIGIVGLDTPKRSASNGSTTPGQFPFLEPLPLSGHLDRDTGTLLRSGSNSPSDSLSSLIEKTLGYRIVHYEQADHQADRQSDTSDTYSQFEEILARTGLVPQDMYQDFDQRSLEGHQPLAMFCEPFDHQVETTLDPVSVVTSLLVDYTQLSPEFGKLLTQYQRDLNNRASTWDTLAHESNIELLTALLWSWIDQLKEPIFDRQALTYIVLKAEKPLDALIKLETVLQGTRYTFEYLLRFIARLRPEAEMFELLLGRLVSSLAQQIVKINGNPVIENPNWTQMRKGTTGRVLLFLNGIYSLLQTN